VLAALQDRRACLMANHGLVAWGRSLSAALALANEVEALCGQYLRACQVGDPVLLSDAEMREVLEKFKGYGEQT
jgi:L-fuculose-phosphate aldolase